MKANVLSVCAAVALLLTSVCAQDSRPAEFAASRPSATSWPEARGGPLNTGRAIGPAPAFRGKVWSVPLGAGVLGQPAVVDGRLYVATVENKAVCLSTVDGAEIFSRRVLPIERDAEGALVGGRFAYAAPLVAFGRLYLGHENGFLYALDQTTGETLFSVRCGEKIWASPKTDGEHLIVATTDGDLLILDPATGATRKSFRTGFELGATPTLIGRTLFVFGAGGRGVKVDLSTLKGEVFEPGFSTSTTAAFGFGRLFVRSKGKGEFLAYDVLRGDVVWRAKEPGDWNRSGSAFDGERVAFTDSKGVHVYDAESGLPAWGFKTPRPVNSSVVFTGDRAVFGCDDGSLYVLHAKDGLEAAVFPLGDGLTASPAAAGGRIYVASANLGIVVAIE